jgi:hypothetical protein
MVRPTIFRKEIDVREIEARSLQGCSVVLYIGKEKASEVWKESKNVPGSPKILCRFKEVSRRGKRSIARNHNMCRYGVL